MNKNSISKLFILLILLSGLDNSNILARSGGRGGGGRGHGGGHRGGGHRGGGFRHSGARRGGFGRRGGYGHRGYRRAGYGRYGYGRRGYGYGWGWGVPVGLGLGAAYYYNRPYYDYPYYDSYEPTTIVTSSGLSSSYPTDDSETYVVAPTDYLSDDYSDSDVDDNLESETKSYSDISDDF